ncbi:sulfite exporter TauE/SafE family protein [Halioxenophilus sp. WMMB6]|uniref:sulfite exporter TauE/SafE family protein n=1 Tax=Halioxenophilus sp. WMMB6 TaxID=3073815 RepID=UPI00295EEEFD|nr:sulfite exporter TauE/SafE family protein [Halioxenophilus sp. WMMB6]
MVDFELTNLALLALFLAVTAASFITSVTGMAGGVLMFAAMNLCIPVRALVPIHGVVQLFNNAARSIYLRRYLRWPIIWPFTLGALLGVTLTTLFVARLVGEFWPLLIILLLIAYTLFRPARLPPIRVSDGNYFWVGVATGSLGIVAGIIDPILAIFFMRDDLSKEAIVANKSLLQMVVHFSKIPAFLYLGFPFLEHLGLLIILSLAGVLGARIGIHVLYRINANFFMRLMKVALLLAGLRIGYQLLEMSLPL